MAVLTVRHVVDRVPAADGRGNLDRGERIRRCRVDKGRALPEPPGVMLCAWCRHAPCRRHDHDHDDHAPGRAAHLPRVAVEPDLGNLQAAATTGHQTIPTNSSDDRPCGRSNQRSPAVSTGGGDAHLEAEAPGLEERVVVVLACGPRRARGIASGGAISESEGGVRQPLARGTDRPRTRAAGGGRGAHRTRTWRAPGQTGRCPAKPTPPGYGLKGGDEHSHLYQKTLLKLLLNQASPP